MSLTFDFPGFHKQFSSDQTDSSAAVNAAEPQSHSWQADLDEFSGDADDDVGAAEQQEADARGSNTSATATPPDAVLHLLLPLLSVKDAMAVALSCQAWYESILDSSSTWAEMEKALLVNGCWPYPPHRGAKPLQLPPSLGTTPLLHLKTTLSTTKIALQFFVLRKGYELMVSEFEALWSALQQQTKLRKQHMSEQQQLVLTGGRQLQRMVDKLALHNWELTYSGYSTLLAARCDEITQQLREVVWRQQQRQQQQQTVSLPGQQTTPSQLQATQPQHQGGSLTGAACSSCSSAAATAAPAAPLPPAFDAAVLLCDCAGGILSDIESVSGGLGAGELLAGEPELLAAATRRGPRPAAAIALWSHLLAAFDTYRRWLDLVTARCGLLGARVAAARQLGEAAGGASASSASSLGGSGGNAALLPHLRNKGLLMFRGHVLLAYGLRRLLQEAALWLAAAASADAAAWRSGVGGCSESDLELLTRVRKLLTECDCADGLDEEVGQHTHAKARRCFGALLTRQRRSRCLPASAW